MCVYVCVCVCVCVCVGGIFIYSSSHTVKTIAFKKNPSGRTRIYEYTPPPNYRAMNGPGEVSNINYMHLYYDLMTAYCRMFEACTVPDNNIVSALSDM